MRKLLLTSLLLLAVLLLALSLQNRPAGRQVQSRLEAAAAAPEQSGFAQADGPRPLQFPADQGPHPNFQTEWWYYTGNLETPTGRHFGFQLTFFRRALLPPTLPTPADAAGSDWSTRQVYLAHFALTDVQGKHFYAFQSLSRAAAGLAGAQSDPFQVWLDDWQVRETAPNRFQLHAAQEDVVVELSLEDSKGPVLQGDNGYSRKGPQPGQASYYYSRTHLASQGTVQVNGETFPVTGLSWMDHEFSTSYLSKNQTGWDWFALQLENGSELMVFQIRQTDGSIDPYSSGTFVAADGSLTHLTNQEFQIRVLDTWVSPHSGAVYPSRWTVSVPRLGLQLNVQPYLSDQELNLAYTYWEGAVHLEGQLGGKTLRGDGYVELTGYAGSMGGEF
jgi:predicted secreted hydrolase